MDGVVGIERGKLPGVLVGDVGAGWDAARLQLLLYLFVIGRHSGRVSITAIGLVVCGNDTVKTDLGVRAHNASTIG